jgi:hypothetical protein
MFNEFEEHYILRLGVEALDNKPMHLTCWLTASFIAVISKNSLSRRVIVLLRASHV